MDSPFVVLAAIFAFAAAFGFAAAAFVVAPALASDVVVFGLTVLVSVTAAFAIFAVVFCVLDVVALAAVLLTLEGPLISVSVFFSAAAAAALFGGMMAVFAGDVRTQVRCCAVTRRGRQDDYLFEAALPVCVFQGEDVSSVCRSKQAVMCRQCRNVWCCYDGRMRALYCPAIFFELHRVAAVIAPQDTRAASYVSTPLRQTLTLHLQLQLLGNHF